MSLPVAEYQSLQEKKSEETMGELRELKARITELTEKLFKVEERFALGEIDRDVYVRISTKLKDDKEALSASLTKFKINLSNPSVLIRNSVEKVANLRNWWVSGDAMTKHNMQKLLFP